MFAYYLRVEKVFLENKKAHTGQIKGITAGLKPTEKQKKFDTFTVSNLIYYNGGADETRTRYLFHAMEALSQVSYSPTSLLTYITIY